MKPIIIIYNIIVIISFLTNWLNSIKIDNNGFVISARSLPISDRVEQRATGRAIRKGWPNKFWTRIRLPAKHVDPAHNCGKYFDNNDTNNNSNNK